MHKGDQWSHFDYNGHSNVRWAMPNIFEKPLDINLRKFMYNIRLIEGLRA